MVQEIHQSLTSSKSSHRSEVVSLDGIGDINRECIFPEGSAKIQEGYSLVPSKVQGGLCKSFAFRCFESLDLPKLYFFSFYNKPQSLEVAGR
ncbi:hypothetical protein TNCV_4814531 [Trichonephila clavipes]|nr:hypothetical protein TNCV_4814531 [Trichonephila clavipes]